MQIVRMNRKSVFLTTATTPSVLRIPREKPENDANLAVIPAVVLQSATVPASALAASSYDTNTAWTLREGPPMSPKFADWQVSCVYLSPGWRLFNSRRRKRERASKQQQHSGQSADHSFLLETHVPVDFMTSQSPDPRPLGSVVYIRINTQLLLYYFY